MPQLIERGLNQEEIDEDGPISMSFDESGFGSQLVLLNLGSTFIFLFIQIFLLILIGLLLPIKCASNRLRAAFNFLAKRNVWSGTIRFIIQQFQPLLISSLINLTIFMHTDLSQASAGMKFSYSLANITIIILGSSIPVFIYVIYKANFDEQFNQKYGPLIEGLNQKSVISRYWMPITLLKWTLMSLSLVLLREVPSLQIISLFILSLISNALQLAGSPQETKVEQVISMFNEGMTSIYIYTQMCLTDLGTLDDRDNLGITLFAIMIFTFSVNFIKVMYCFGKEIIAKVKLACQKMRESRNTDRVINLQTTKTKIYTLEESKVDPLEKECVLPRGFSKCYQSKTTLKFNQNQDLIQ
ncbi:hypothetical protein FGO68_gene3421 [Halteria grandinella]|uniref:Transmembrane protein n=1 Tax=Halteria grandinella TaxID=5974 RepID=A0A8J8P6I1_HALGN|nr:hypothetical protein FGO68_gene3421 [Halteria grandinella]